MRRTLARTRSSRGSCLAPPASPTAAPTYVHYAAIVVAALIVLPGYER
jgi:hypothetical protein